MEDLIKDALPKEVIEIQEIVVPPEPQSGGLSGGEITVIAVLVVGALALLAKAKCKCKK
tara:strand:+ start:371 stop:547 length:177 start_codon:yes stop_codon:yes gene_type:complete